MTATSMGYAKNGSAVTFVFGETWNESGSGAPINYDITYAREFRYAGARQRYLSRELDPDGLELNGQVQSPVILTSLSETWTDYDGDQPYGDFSYDSGSLQNTRSYQLGIGTFGWSGGNPDSTTLSFYHSDMIGTTRLTTDSAGTLADSAVYTAFGERVSGSANHYGYAGAFGYQTDDTGNFPFQHVGARYYDPSIGRFLQRDPIGIQGGVNVYAYVQNSPTGNIDPSGLIPPFALEGVKGGFEAYESMNILGCGAESSRDDSRRRHIANKHPGDSRNSRYHRRCRTCQRHKRAERNRNRRRWNRRNYPHFKWYQFWNWGLNDWAAG